MKTRKAKAKRQDKTKPAKLDPETAELAELEYVAGKAKTMACRNYDGALGVFIARGFSNLGKSHRVAMYLYHRGLLKRPTGGFLTLTTLPLAYIRAGEIRHVGCLLAWFFANGHRAVGVVLAADGATTAYGFWMKARRTVEVDEYQVKEISAVVN